MNVRIFILALLFPLLTSAAVDVVFPARNAKLPYVEKCHVIGSAKISGKPLICNGRKIELQKSGAFLFMQPVKPGKNILEFTVGGKKQVHCFNVASAPAAHRRAAIIPVSPLSGVGVTPGEKVSLCCTAPTGRVVRAMVGERDILMKESASTPGRYEASVKFNGNAVRVPVLFWSEGLTDVSAGTITAKSEWEGVEVAAGLFEVRVFDSPGGNTIGYLTPSFKFGSNGFSGAYTRTVFAGRTGFVPSKFLRPAKRVKFNPNLPMPDLAKGFPSKPPPGSRRSDVLVVIDAGHGGSDPGAIGPCRTTEKEVNLSQARQIEKKLKEAGYRTLMTRNKDVFVGLYDRARYAYKHKASAFISIHHNATGISGNPDVARNIATYCSNERGEPLASCIQRRVAPLSGIPDGGVRRRSFAVCRNPAIPSCLIEFDFITSPSGELAILDKKRQEAFAEGVMKGIDDWAGIK